MRPIKLSLQAFGPFAGVEQVEFDKFGAAPLFLINGPTGAGKSSVLDAICYALYGETTGSERTGDQMRCDYADPHLTTEVRFEFSLGDKQYAVVRSPDQEVPKKRGDGFTRKTHAATLTQITQGDETLLANKPTPVRKAIEELIGLEVNQFRQVMVLPQGKFRDLLIANSKDREVIFGQLFQTQIYTQIERALFDKAAGIRKEKDQFDNQIKGALDVASLASEAELQQELSVTKPLVVQSEREYQAQQNKRDEIKQQLSQAELLVGKYNQRELLNKDLQVLNQSTSQIESDKIRLVKARQASQLTTIHQPFHSAQQQLDVVMLKQKQAQVEFELCEKQLKEAELAAKLATQNASVIPDKNKTLYELQSIEKNIRLIGEHEQRRVAANQTVKAAQEFRTVLEGRIAKGEVHVKEKRAELEALKEKVAQIDVKQWQLKTLGQNIELRHKEQALQTKLQALLSKKSGAETQLVQSKAISEASRVAANKLELQWHRNQAALLAATLEDDQPCPVCGSHTHPAPAMADGDVVTKEQVDNARTIQQRDYDHEVMLANSVEKIVVELEHLKSEMQQLLMQLAEVPQLAELNQNKKALQQELEQLSALDVQQHSLMLDKAEKKLVALREEYQRQLRVIEEAQKNQTRLQTELDSLNQSLTPELDTLEKVLCHKQTLEQEIAQLTTQEQQTQQHFVTVQNQLSALRSTVNSLNQQINQWQLDVDVNEKKWQSALEQSDFNNLDEYKLSIMDKEAQDQIQARVSAHDSQLSKLSGQVEALDKELENQPKPEVEPIKDKLYECQTEVNRTFQVFTQYKSKLDNLTQVAQKLKLLYQHNETLEKEYQVFGTLSDIANGRTGAKVSLHRFVLGVLLDDVLIQASQRLQIMSKGRYLLKRKQERAKGNAGSGLDLMVEDGYTGKWRDVATLSGGESFMAALSLALGVSDVVQSYSGGVRLDTLFIDEGFGSLDPESLDLAVQTLVDLQQGGRTIGIISHVSELKEQLALRLDIQTSRSGSVIKLIA